MNTNCTEKQKVRTYKLALFLLTLDCKRMEVSCSVTVFLKFSIKILFINKLSSSASGFIALIKNIIFFPAKLMGTESGLQS